MECPGKANCPQGSRCVAEAALDRARAAQVVVTNHHLYALHLSSGNRILPEHDVAVIDEAHRLEAALSSAFAVDVSGWRLAPSSPTPVAWWTPSAAPPPSKRSRSRARRLGAAVASLPAARVDTSEGELGGAILTASRAVATAAGTLRRVEDADPIAGAVARVQTQAGHLVGDFEFALDLPDGSVAWVEPDRAVVRVAPVEVDASLAAHLLVTRPTVLTSATLTVGGSFTPLAARLGFLEQALDPDPFAGDAPDPVARTYRPLRVEGSFDYARQGLLYVASHLPDPREDAWSDAAAAEIARLTTASGGRALVLTTSHRMLGVVAGRLDGAPFRVLVQGELPKKRLVAEFAVDETSTLVATMGYWEGIDVPGRSLSLVVIDRIPFPRPDDPLMQARRTRSRHAVAARSTPSTSPTPPCCSPRERGVSSAVRTIRAWWQCSTAGSRNAATGNGCCDRCRGCCGPATPSAPSAICATSGGLPRQPVRRASVGDTPGGEGRGRGGGGGMEEKGGVHIEE